MEKGDKHNMLTAVKFSHKSGSRSRPYWIFKCDCGNEKAMRIDSVSTGHVKSCDCIGRGAKRKAVSFCRDYRRMYATWSSMKQRCFDDKHKSYKDYGGRGITVCERWMDFENFLADMKERAEGMTIDRIDVNGNYEPLNCRWITNKEQQGNRRNNHIVIYNGKKMILAELEIVNPLVARRIEKGWSYEEALNIPKNRARKTVKKKL